MKHFAKIFVLALSLAALLFAGVAGADSSKLPEPASPSKGVIADGRINVYLGSPRVNGYAIGDSIPVTIVFEMQPPSAEDLAAAAEKKEEGKPERQAPKKFLPMPKVNVEGLKMQVQSAEALDVEMLTGATEVSSYTREGKEYLKVVFYVWQFVTTKQTQVEVKADFMYATHQLEDGQPDWRKASTPVLNIGIRKTATDNQVTLLEGNLKAMQSPSVPAAFWFLVLGPLLMLPLVGALAYIGYQRYMAPRKLSANEEVWLELDPVFAAGAEKGFTLDQYRRIFFVLRRRFGVLALDGVELIAALKKHSDLAKADLKVLEHVFGMESVFYAKASEITKDEQSAFMAGIKMLVPRQ